MTMRSLPSGSGLPRLMSIVVIGMALLWSASSKAQEDPRKEWVKLSYTEFCSVVPDVPKLTEDVQNIFASFPQLAKLARWIEQVGSLRKERCNDS